MVAVASHVWRVSQPVMFWVLITVSHGDPGYAHPGSPLRVHSVPPLETQLPLYAMGVSLEAVKPTKEVSSKSNSVPPVCPSHFVASQEPAVQPQSAVICCT